MYSLACSSDCSTSADAYRLPRVIRLRRCSCDQTSDPTTRTTAATTITNIRLNPLSLLARTLNGVRRCPGGTVDIQGNLPIAQRVQPQVTFIQLGTLRRVGRVSLSRRSGARYRNANGGVFHGFLCFRVEDQDAEVQRADDGISRQHSHSQQIGPGHLVDHHQPHRAVGRGVSLPYNPRPIPPGIASIARGRPETARKAGWSWVRRLSALSWANYTGGWPLSRRTSLMILRTQVSSDGYSNSNSPSSRLLSTR